MVHIICEPSDVMSGIGNAHTCMVHVLYAKISASKYLSGLACMQANLNLDKITASHFQVLNIQNANENMPNMIPIAYLNENLMDYNKNLAWGK